MFFSGDKIKAKKQFYSLIDLSKGQERFKLDWKEKHLCFGENTSSTAFDYHYVYHPAWAIRIVKKINPEFHVDISSTLHFCSALSAFIPVKFFDFRPANLILPDLTSEAADLTNLHFRDNSIKSLSCMHTVEHIGLGRYGDPLDYNGDLKAINELKRVLASGGDLLFVVPIGKPRIQFNAHRIYSYRQVVEYFSGLRLEEFSLIPDNPEHGIIYNAAEEISDKQNYGCGCFWFKKP
ncbi:MAG: DUF268 domain-containing protein [Cytophagaceae bacterium]